MRRTAVPRLVLLCSVGVLLLSACGRSGQSRDAEPSTYPELSPDEAFRLVQAHAGDSSFVLLDVRTPAEFANERLAGARNLDFRSRDFPTSIARLDRDRTYLVYCRTGNRSGQSLSLFRGLGFRDVRHLHGGIQAWKTAGQSVAPAAALPASP